MKRVVFIFCCLPFACAAQKQLLINGKVNGLKEQSLVFLNDANAPTDTIARAFVKNGAFILKGSLREALMVSLNFVDSKKKALLFLDNSNISVSGDINDVQKLSISGSSSQQDFQSFQDIFNPLFAEYSRVQQEAKAKGNTDSVQVAAARSYTTIQENIEMFIQRHPASQVSPFLLVLTSQLSDDVAIVEKRLNRLDSAAQHGFFGRYLRQMIDDANVGAIGSAAIDFTQNDVNGTPISLNSFKGKYVLIDFWASWCGPCRMENPNVVNTYKQFKDKNFTILGVSLDRAKDPWIKAIGDDKLLWTQVSDLKFWNNEVAVKYHIKSIPENFLLDPSGKIIARNLRGEALRQKLCELLGCN